MPRQAFTPIRCANAICAHTVCLPALRQQNSTSLKFRLRKPACFTIIRSRFKPYPPNHRGLNLETPQARPSPLAAFRRLCVL